MSVDYILVLFKHIELFKMMIATFHLVLAERRALATFVRRAFFIKSKTKFAFVLLVEGFLLVVAQLCLAVIKVILELPDVSQIYFRDHGRLLSCFLLLLVERVFDKSIDVHDISFILHHIK